MQTLQLTIQNFLAWLSMATLHGAVVVVLVVATQVLFRRQLTRRWHYCLWALVVIRLLLPVNLPSSFSLFNATASAWSFLTSELPAGPSGVSTTVTGQQREEIKDPPPMQVGTVEDETVVDVLEDWLKNIESKKNEP